MADITKIKQVVQATDETFDDYIAKGFVLLHVCSQTHVSKTGASSVDIIYIMGHEEPRSNQAETVNIQINT